MAIDKKFIHFKTYDNFISHNGIGSEANITTPTEGSEDTGDAIYGQIKGSSVVFIKDVQKMWTHGQLYDCGGGSNMSEQDPVFMASPAATITEAKKTEWDNKVDKVNGKQLSTEDFTTALKNKLEGLNDYDDTELSSALSTLRSDFDKLVSGDTTTAIKTFNEVIAFLDGLTDTQDLESIIASIEQQIAGKMDKVTLATVATSGSYNDLSNKPTIPAAVTESTVSGWGFTKNTGTYSKPSGGIPKSDLASAVQTSLGKADTALQSYTEQYKGTVTGVKINGTTKSQSNGIVDLGTVITAHQTLKTINGESIVGDGDLSIQSANNIVNLNIGSLPTQNSNVTVNFTEDQQQILRLEDTVIKLTFIHMGKQHICTMFHTISGVMHVYSGVAYTVKNSVVYDTTRRYVYGQFNHASNTITFTISDIIITGSDVKTINGQSIVGSGDITISGGSSDANVQAVDTGDVLDDVNVEYATKTYVDNKVANISLTDYATITYVDGLVGDINSVLESIISGGGSNEITFYIDDGGYVTSMKALPNMTWEEFVNSEYANQNSMFTNFRLFSMGSYNGIVFYHEEATQDLTLFNDDTTNVADNDVIEVGKTYYAQ